MGLWNKMAAVLGARRPPHGAPGARAYAIGDVHGRLELLDQLLDSIEEDRGAAGDGGQCYVIFLGDYIDRGPDSAGVIDRLRGYRPEGVTPILLGGNHEDVLLRLLKGERGLLSGWLKFGGGECARSYGLDPAALAGIDERVALSRLRDAVPKAHQRFLADCADTFRFGDYLFVHAGIRPGLPLAEQDIADLRWIRAPFLDDRQEHGFVVVHGHTVVPEVEELPNRIAIDTGAYRSGVLTALCIDGSRRWLLQTGRGDRRGQVGEVEDFNRA